MSNVVKPGGLTGIGIGLTCIGIGLTGIGIGLTGIGIGLTGIGIGLTGIGIGLTGIGIGLTGIGIGLTGIGIGLTGIGIGLTGIGIGLTGIGIGLTGIGIGLTGIGIGLTGIGIGLTGIGIGLTGIGIGLTGIGIGLTGIGIGLTGIGIGLTGIGIGLTGIGIGLTGIGIGLTGIGIGLTGIGIGLTGIGIGLTGIGIGLTGIGIGLTGIGIGLTWNLRKDFDLIVKHLILFLTGLGRNSKRNQQTQNLIQQRLIDSSQAHFTGALMAHSSLQLDIYSESQKSWLAKFFIKLLVLLYIYYAKSSSGYRPATDDEWADELKGFMKYYGFPCIAAWDGFHVYLSTRLKQYFSFKKRYTVTNMGLISYNKRFLYAAVGAPGNTHDTRLLKNCSLYKKILTGDAIPQKSVNLGNYGEIPDVTIGDNAFPKHSWLIKAYNEETNVTQEKYFNKYLFKARVVTEMHMA